MAEKVKMPSNFNSSISSADFIELRGGSQELDSKLIEGNIFVNEKAICDDNWGEKEATVICR